MSQKPIFSFLICMLRSIFYIRSTYNFTKCTTEKNLCAKNLKLPWGLMLESGKKLTVRASATTIVDTPYVSPTDLMNKIF